MSSIQIPNLPQATAATPQDLVEVVQNGVSYKMPLSLIIALKFAVYTVANLPSASTTGVGGRAFVTDATATTFDSIVAGSGTNKVPVFSDGSVWRIG